VALVAEDREQESPQEEEDQLGDRVAQEECRAPEAPEDQVDQVVREERDLRDWDNPLNLIRIFISAFITTEE
jgi:hypothetical protein